MILRNQQKTQKTALESRNAQFFVQLYKNEFYHKGVQDIFGERRWDSFEEWWALEGPIENPEAFSEWFQGMSTLEIIGVFVKRGFMDVELIDDVMSGYILIIWDIYGPIIEELRDVYGYPQLQEHQEYLVNEIRKIVEKQHSNYVGKLNR